jgi:hypothetical protein
MPETRNVVVVAGGAWQIFLVNFLKAKGHRVWVVNPVVSETVEAAGNHIPLDIRRVDEIVAYIREHRLDPLFVTSDQSDLATQTVALVSRALGLPGNDPGSVDVFADKAVMYRFARSAGAPVAEFDEVRDAGGVRTFAGRVGLPVIVKPTRSTASRGFAKIDRVDQIDAAAALALRYSPTGSFIVQKYVGGPSVLELTAEGLCSAGRHRTLTTSLREMYLPGINSAIRYPSGLDVDAILRVNDHFVHASKVGFGLTHAEYFYDADTKEFFLTEIACRGGGVGIASHVVPWVTGLDTYEVLYRNLLGDGRPPPPDRCRRPALIQFFHRHEMEPLGPEEVAELERLAGVFFYNYRRHDFLRSEADDLNCRHSLAILLRETDEEIARDLRAMRAVVAAVRVAG